MCDVRKRGESRETSVFWLEYLVLVPLLGKLGKEQSFNQGNQRFSYGLVMLMVPIRLPSVYVN